MAAIAADAGRSCCQVAAGQKRWSLRASQLRRMAAAPSSIDGLGRGGIACSASGHRAREVSTLAWQTRPATLPCTAGCSARPALLPTALPAVSTTAALPAVSSRPPVGLPCLAPRPAPQAPRRPCSHVAHAGLELAALATNPLLRDSVCCVAAGLGAKVWTKVFDLLVTKGVLEQKLSRKLVHTTTGPIFILTWPLFSASPAARIFAAVVPALNAARLLAVGSGVVKDEGLVASVSRSGDRSELLKGPLYYCLVLIATTLLCWRDDPAGMIVVSLMCGGDGLADIVGRRWGAAKLPYNTAKSWAGSAAMLLGGMGMALGLIALYCWLGFFDCLPLAVLLPALLGISLVATLVESLPINQVFDDNLSVPVVAAVMAMILLPHAVQAAGLMGAAVL